MQVSGRVAPRSLVSAAGLLPFADLHPSFYYHTLLCVQCMLLLCCTPVSQCYFIHIYVAPLAPKKQQEEFITISAADVLYSHLRQLYRICVIRRVLCINFHYIQQSTQL